MKRRNYFRPVSVILEKKVFEDLESITDHKQISFSDYLRSAIKEKLQKDHSEKSE